MYCSCFMQSHLQKLRVHISYMHQFNSCYAHLYTVLCHLPMLNLPLCSLLPSFLPSLPPLSSPLSSCPLPLSPPALLPSLLLPSPPPPPALPPSSSPPSSSGVSARCVQEKEGDEGARQDTHLLVRKVCLSPGKGAPQGHYSGPAPSTALGEGQRTANAPQHDPFVVYSQHFAHNPSLYSKVDLPVQQHRCLLRHKRLPACLAGAVYCLD